MAKQKTRPDRSGFLSRLKDSLHKPKVTDDRLAILAVELGLAGGEILREDFGFTEAQVALWLDKMLTRAKVNRVTSLARLAVEQIDNPT